MIQWSTQQGRIVLRWSYFSTSHSRSWWTEVCQLFVQINYQASVTHSFSSLSYDRSKASSTVSCPICATRASSFKWDYPLLSLRSSSSFLHLLPRLPVTSIPPFIFPSITHCRRQFLRTMWPIQLAFRLLISCRIFLCSLTLCNTSSFLTWSVQLIFSILLQHHISKLSSCFWSTARIVQVSAPYKAVLQLLHFTSFVLNFKSNVLVKRALFLLNAAFAIAVLHLILQVHCPLFVNMLRKDSTLSSCFWSIVIFTGIGCLEILLKHFYTRTDKRKECK